MPDQVGDAVSSSVPRPRVRWRLFLLPVAIVLGAVASVVAVWQTPHPDVFEPVTDWSHRGVLYPRETNAFARLPIISEDLGPIAVSNPHVWVLAGRAKILHSDDAGQTWSAQDVPVPADLALTDVFFIDPQNGWAAATNMVLFRTTDSGKTWTRDSRVTTVPSIPGVKVRFGGLRGILASPEGMAETRDGGVTWSASRTGASAVSILRDGSAAWIARGTAVVRLDATPVTVGTLPDYVFSLHFEDLRNGFATTRRGVYRTTNGGASWERKIPPRKDWVVTDDGSIALHTKDDGFVRAGSDWVYRRQRLRGFDMLRDVSMLDEKTGIAVGQSGWMLRTTDGGLTWGQISAPLRYSNALHASADGDEVWSAGAHGTLLRSEDGGKTWIPGRNDDPSDLNAIAFADDTGWAAGQEGTVLRSTDRGATWSPVAVGNGADFTTVRVSADGRWILLSGSGGYEIGPNGASGSFGTSTFISRNAGANWYSLQTALPVFFIDTVHGWELRERADGGTDLYNTRNGGLSWRFVRTIPHKITTIDFTADGTNVWLRDEGLPLLYSPDGGVRWQTMTPADVGRVQAVRFRNARQGWAELVEDGRKLVTSDGGITWRDVTSDPHLFRVEPLIFSVDGEQAWTTTYEGTPLHSDDGGQTWTRIEPGRSPAGWLLIALSLLIVLVIFAVKDTEEPRAETTIEEYPANDEPVSRLADDRLGFEPLANGIIRFIANPNTEPPLTIAVTDPILHDCKLTPRSMKRCVNRVRYYSMRMAQRPIPATPSERVAAWFTKQPERPPLENLHVPDHILVTLGVLQHVNPEWTADRAFWHDPARFLQGRVDTKILDTLIELQRKGGIREYRDEFVHISQGLRLGGEEEAGTEG